MQFRIEKDGETVGVVMADSEDEAREELADGRVFGDAPIELFEVAE